MSNIIEVKNLSYSYSADNLAKDTALVNVSFGFEQGEFIGIAGHTGSGKSTVAQILAGLLTPSEGRIFIDGEEIEDYKAACRALRRRVGIVFQYPEHQLFEETVYKDIAFGPKNKGLSEEEIDRCVRKSALLAGVSEKLFEESPFELSGGQKRRVAIAGVLATEPKVLILDEPAAGLDPKSKHKLLKELHKIQKEENTTIILISHSMEDLSEHAQRIIVLNHGVKFKDASPKDIFSSQKALRECGLEIPEIAQVVSILNSKGMDIPGDIFTLKEAYYAIAQKLGVGK